ncbi:TPA: hypothetical protein ACH3X3_008960 [Trebouxia sp. C0006]
MGLRQNLEDFARDFCTRIDGATELVQNVLTRIRQPTPRLPTHNFHGKVCIITGGNAGVGQATAEAMVARGARVIIACRDEGRARAAAEALSTTTTQEGCEGYPVEVGSLDLASLDSVRSFASSFNARGLPLALLICNAGIMAPPKRLVTKDGFEQQFQVNYLGHWMLTHLLLAGQQRQRANSNVHRTSNRHQDSTADSHPQHQHQSHMLSQALQDSQQSAQQHGHQQPYADSAGTRVVMLTSLTYRAGRIKFDDLRAERSYSGFHRYADSKLAELLAVKEFAERMDRSPDPGPRNTIVAVHPGLLKTELARKWLHNDYCPNLLQPVCSLVIDFLFNRTFLPPLYAVQAVLQAATAPASKVHGRYIARNKVTVPAKHAQDGVTASRLWDVSCQLTGIKFDVM